MGWRAASLGAVAAVSGTLRPALFHTWQGCSRAVTLFQPTNSCTHFNLAKRQRFGKDYKRRSLHTGQTWRGKAMTESEWLERTDPNPMLKFLEGKASDRKVRLFVCACCRHIWHKFTADSIQQGHSAVDIAERLADGEAESGEVATVRTQIKELIRIKEQQWAEESRSE